MAIYFRNIIPLPYYIMNLYVFVSVNLGQIPPNAPNKLIYGIFGVIRLVAGKYHAEKLQ